MKIHNKECAPKYEVALEPLFKAMAADETIEYVVCQPHAGGHTTAQEFTINNFKATDYLPEGGFGETFDQLDDQVRVVDAEYTSGPRMNRSTFNMGWVEKFKLAGQEEVVVNAHKKTDNQAVDTSTTVKKPPVKSVSNTPPVQMNIH
jgi:hypothetical protein